MNIKDRIAELYHLFSPCYLCPLNCGVNRDNGEVGLCGAGKNIKIASFSLYKGEEPPLVGNKGSGTIFFSYCNLKCVYCQNYNFSQLGRGKEISIETLADIMLKLQGRGAVNINLVTPAHFIPQIAEAIFVARKSGLVLPIVYNTSGYESVKTIKLLKNIVDIYLTDFRYGTDAFGKKYSGVPYYTEIAKAAVKEMYNQVGNLSMDSKGIAKKGIIIRHLLFPEGIGELKNVVNFITNDLSKDIYFSLMSQYIPVYQAKMYPEINREITKKEFFLASRIVRDAGIRNGWIQYK